MASVRFVGAGRRYPGSARPAVDSLDLEIEDGEFMVLVGPSGCGKSTSLRMLAGLEDCSEGSIMIGERDVTTEVPKDRDIAMVFQNYALYPHMSVADNMGFALRVAGVGKAERAQRVREAARLLDLEDYLDRKPKALSGGQRQRVAMGRAIVRRPEVFLMDEPLSNLDAKLRVSTRTQIAALQQRLGVTTVYVTHDQTEAMTMGDRVAVLKDGVLQQVDTPLALYDRPVNQFVASFIGSPAMNLLPATVEGGDAVVAGHRIPLERSVAARAGDAVTVGVRPHAWRLTMPGEAGLQGTLRVVEELGADSFVYVTPRDPTLADAITQAVVRVEGRQRLEKGEPVGLVVDPTDVHVFDAASGERLSA
jgi:multiple sugar transport system ATP-binding protein